MRVQREENNFYFLVHNPLVFCRLFLVLHHHDSLAQLFRNIYERSTTTFQYWMNERYVRYVTDRQINIIKISTFVVEMYSTTCIELVGDLFVLDWRKSIQFWRRYTRKNEFYIFTFSSPVTLTFDLLSSICSHIVSFVHHYVSCKL